MGECGDEEEGDAEAGEDGGDLKVVAVDDVASGDGEEDEDGKGFWF